MQNPMLSEKVADGLRSLNTVISSDLTKKLISNAIKMALHSDANIPPNPEIYASKPNYTKQAEYAVLAVLFLAVKHNLDSHRMRDFLEGHKVSQLAIEEIIHVYEHNKSDLRIRNIITGHSLPHVTNVEWKLTCDIKSSTLDGGNGELNYRINLGRFHEKTGERECIVEFVCNTEELQSLVNKLKDIERHCEKIASCN